MTKPDEFGEEPTADVLEQQRDDAPAEYDDRATATLPAEAAEADYADQQIAVQPEDDR